MVKRGGFLWGLYACLFTIAGILTAFFVHKKHQDTKTTVLSSIWFLWPALDLWLFSLIYFSGSVDWGTWVISKNRKTGRITLRSKIVHFPFLQISYLTWLSKQYLKNEEVYHKVADRIYVGKYPKHYPRDYPHEADIVVDLTVEFSEPREIVSTRAYHCYPCLDFVLTKDVVVLAELANHLAKQRQHSLYIHCANGHGRSATLAGMILILRGECKNMEQAGNQMRRFRKTIKFNDYQVSIAEEALEYIDSEAYSKARLNTALIAEVTFADDI